MKKYDVIIPITSVARVTLNAENKEQAKEFAILALENELYGEYNPHADNVEDTYLAIEDYESFAINEDSEDIVIEETDERGGSLGESEEDFEGTGMCERDIRNLTIEEMEELGIYDDEDY